MRVGHDAGRGLSWHAAECALKSGHANRTIGDLRFLDSLIELTVSADGSSTQPLAGASQFPRHWLYDDGGHLVEKAALTRIMQWESTAVGRHTPWGGEDQEPVVAPPETELELALAEQVMRGGSQPAVRELAAGEFLFRQSEPGTSPALVLDGNFEVRVDGQTVG